MFRIHSVSKSMIALVVALSMLLSMTTVLAQEGEEFVISDAYAGTQVRVIAANHPWNEALQRLIPEFEAASGITIRLESYFEDQLAASSDRPDRRYGGS